MAKEGDLGLEITELRLGLPGAKKREPKKRAFSEMEDGKSVAGETAKSQAVGWPPVCSYRRKNSLKEKAYVKVSMDGAPFLRKIDLSMHSAYPHLALALDNLFSSFALGEGLKDGDSCEFAPIYEDRDGDWMLVGDVPWEMFVESCKRLRIMKKSDALGIGLEPKNFLLKGNSLKNETK